MSSMANKSEIWFSCLRNFRITDSNKFYDSKEFPWVEILENNSELIFDECKKFIRDNDARIKPYFNEEMVSKRNRWRAFSFMFWSVKMKKNLEKCPQISHVLKQIPGLISASVSILEPHTEIFPHRGDTNAIYRCHLGLKIPASLPDCGFNVGGEERSWVQGKTLTFEDSAEHFAWNNTNERRYVLLLDIIKPEFALYKDYVSSIVLSGLVNQALIQKMPFVNKLPVGIKKLILYFNSVWIRIVLSLKG